MHRLPRLVLALILSGGVFPAAGMAVPSLVEPVVAAPKTCGDGALENITAGESGDSAEGTIVDCLVGGTGIDDSEPPTSSTGRWCSSGWGTWNHPLTIDKATGEVIVAPGTTSVSRNGTAGSPALDALYQEARWRAYQAARGAGGLGSSFYWQTGLIELTAMILQIEPVYVRGDSLSSGGITWRFRNMTGLGKVRTQYWTTQPNGLPRETTTVVPGRLSAIVIIPRFNEKQLVTLPSNATRVRVSSSDPTIWTAARALAPAGATRTAIESAIFAEVGRQFARSEGASGSAGYSIEQLADLFLTPYAGWNSGDLKQSATTGLRAAYRNAAVKWGGAGGDPTVAIDLAWVDTDPVNGFTAPRRLREASQIASLPDTARVGFYVYTPSRVPLTGAGDDTALKQQLIEIVQRNLTGRRIGQMPFDDYGPVSKPENKYAFPVFHAPTPNTAPASICTRDEFELAGISPTISVKHGTPWVPGSPNGCLTSSVSSLASFTANITVRGECWLNWRIIDIPEPRFLWSDELLELLPQVNVKQVTVTGTRIGGAVYDPITITARRTAAGTVAYRDDVGALTNIPRSTTNKSNAVATLPTYYNLTQVGVTAEVGIPGLGGFIAQGGRVARQTNRGTEYDLALTFTQTPLERLQNSQCRRLSVANLLRVCGIGYDAINKEWYYNVRIRTWYGGIYYAPAAEMNDPKLRGLFNPYHTVGIRRFVDAVPKRIRNFVWPGDATGFTQQTGIRFPGTGDGIASPLFGPTPGASAADLSYLREMVCMSDGKSAACGDPSPDPSRPAYYYTQPNTPTGSFYPLFDASGGATGACPVASDNTACAVKVYVRSRQPILDR